LAARPASGLSAHRFLGWKYAFRTHQNTDRWLRKHAPSLAAVANSGQAADTSTHVSSAAAVAGFAAPPNLPTGFLPTAVAQGDFNGDGKVDLAISNGGDNTIYVYLGNGDGTFAIPEVLNTTGQAPLWLTAAKLRTNGFLDLIAVDADTNQVEVFSGNGDGTFQAGAIVAATPEIPTFVVAGDFNGDGHVDLAIGLIVPADGGGPQFEVLPGNGSGAFTSAILPPSIVPEDDLPTTWLAASDLNNDGQTDFIATSAGAVAISYLSQGGTAFSAGNSFNPADIALAVAVADMDGDGCADAIETGAGGFITIAKGNCDGTFTQGPPTAEAGDYDFALTVADINGDGKLDVVASSAFSDGLAQGGTGAYGGYLVSVLDGDGAGHLAPPAIYRAGPDAYSLVVADLLGNGRPDILAISQTENDATHLSNNGNGGFGALPGEAIGYTGISVYNAPLPGIPPQAVDLNNDGKPDVLLIESPATGAYPLQATSLLNLGSGQFAAPVRTPLSPAYDSPFLVFTTGAFRGKAPDLVTVAQYSASSPVTFMPGNGDGTFGTGATIAALTTQPMLIASGDFNNDGKLDFAVLGQPTGSETSFTAALDVFTGNGDGTFEHLASSTFSISSNNLPLQLLTADVNHDGKLDLLLGLDTNNGWVSSGDDLYLISGNGDGTFQTPVLLMAHFGPVAIADVNHDGYIDLIQSRDPSTNTTQQALNETGGSFITAAAAVYLGGPGGTFSQPTVYTAPGVAEPEYTPVLVGDFNHDGETDIAVPFLPATIGAIWQKQLQIFEGNGDGTFTANAIPYQLPAYDLPVAGADFRGTGNTDLLDLVGTTSSINILAAGLGPSVALNAEAPLIGDTGSATVTLAVPSASTQTVQLAASDAAVEVPSSLSFAPGETAESFTFTIGSGFDKTHLLRLTATQGGSSAVSYVAASNPTNSPSVIALIGGDLPGTTQVATSPGEPLNLFLSLESVQGYGSTFSQFSCSGLPAGVSCQFNAATVRLLPGGYAQVPFELLVPASTEPGNYPIAIHASDGVFSPSASLTLGIGGFSISASGSIVQVNGPSSSNITINAAFSDGYSQTVTLSCGGLPAGATCNPSSELFPASASAQVAVAANSTVAASDYPFTITGTAQNLTSTVPLTLRVSNFTAALESTSATTSNGVPVTFNVKVSSANHFTASSITISCGLGGLNVTETASCSEPPVTALQDGATIIVPFTVTASQVVVISEQKGGDGPLWVPALAALLCLWLPRRRSRGFLTRSFAFLAALALALNLSSCGGGGTSPGSGGSGGGSGSGSSQSLSIPVTVTASTGGNSLQQNAGTITLNVN
jgi:hypothetical protein